MCEYNTWNHTAPTKIFLLKSFDSSKPAKINYRFNLF